MNPERMSLAEIPTGIRLEPVMQMIEEFIPGHVEMSGLASRGIGMDFGSGWGRAGGLLRAAGISSVGIETNLEAVAFARFFKQFAHVGDATLYGQGLHYMGLSHLENNDVGTMIGLLENIPYGWKKAIGTAMMSIVPEGYLVIAGVASPEIENPVLQEYLGTDNYLRYKSEWQRRIAINHALGYEKNVFAVAKPGEHKEVEWGNETDVRSLIEDGSMERLAQHMDLYQLENVLARHDFLPLGVKFDVWGSRLINDESKPPEARFLSGYILISQKVGRYLIHPWYAGMTVDQTIDYKDSHDKHWEQVSYGVNVWHEYLRRIRENIKGYDVQLSHEFIDLFPPYQVEV